MAKYSTFVRDHLFLPGRVLLSQGHEEALRLLGRPIPPPVAARLLIDTGSKRSTLAPSVVGLLDPPVQRTVRAETGLASVLTSLFWVRLEFPGTGLEAIPEIAVARLSLPPSLAVSFDGVLGRDVLFRWEYFLLEGRRRRLTIRDERWRFWVT